MDTDEVHAAVRVERLELADLLAELAPAEWDVPSACPGWTVREVAAHLSAGARARIAAGLVAMIRARGDLDRMIHDEACAHAAAHTPAELIAELRAAADSRRRAPGTSLRTPLLDVLCHGQDIAGPLGRPRAMPRAAAVVAVAEVWRMGFPFRARKRLHGLRLVATDAEWSAGAGAEVRGPVSALLLLTTGRVAALPHLSGPGAAQVATRLPVG